MMNPATELRDFVRATLVVPVERDHAESDSAFIRRRVVSAITLLVGAGVIAWTLRIPPGNKTFYLGTALLALVWMVGALASGPLHLGRARTRAGDRLARPLAQGLLLGGGLLVVFLLGSLLVSHIPVLREPAEELLEHAQVGSLPLIALLTAVNGIAEELYFRGALYAAVGRRHSVLITAGIYTFISALGGIVLLAFAAALLGLLVGLQRRVTGGILGPIVTHLTWSLGMLFLLPWAFALGS